MIPMNVIKEIMTKGFEYTPSLPPERITMRGEVGDCFDTCLIACMAHPELRYVEGMAQDPKTGDWLLHAWVTDEAGKKAYDLTWRAYRDDVEIAFPGKYIGIPMETRLVVLFHKSTGYKSIFSNRHRNPGLVDKIMKQHELRINKKT